MRIATSCFIPMWVCSIWSHQVLPSRFPAPSRFYRSFPFSQPIQLSLLPSPLLGYTFHKFFIPLSKLLLPLRLYTLAWASHNHCINHNENLTISFNMLVKIIDPLLHDVEKHLKLVEHGLLCYYVLYGLYCAIVLLTSLAHTCFSHIFLIKRVCYLDLLLLC